MRAPALPTRGPGTAATAPARRLRRAVRGVATRLAGQLRVAPPLLLLVSVLCLVAVAAAHVRDGWRQREAGARQALQDRALDVAQALGDAVYRGRHNAATLVLAPVLHAVGPAHAEPVPLLPMWRHAAGVFDRHDLSVGPHFGLFRVPLRPRGGPMDGVGALEVPALAARVRAAVDRVRPTDIPPDKWIWTSVWHEGEEILVATAVECDARSVPWALVGVTFTRRPLDASTVRSTLTYTPLLPSNFQGVDWLSARLLAPPAAGVPARAARASLDVRHNRLVDVQVATADGVVLHASRPGLTAAAFASAYAAEYVRAGERLVVRVAFPPARAARLVAAAVPAGPERWLLAAVTGLAGLMSIAGAFGIWQQHRLVESRRNFVAAVSHELRTPLTQLSVLSETLLLGGAESPEQERRWLAAMQRECRRLAVTVENVLLHARADRRTALIGPTPADLAAVVRDVVEQVRAVRAPYPSTLTLDVPPTCAAEVDVGAMRHVLHNLLDNALKHGGQRPHVRVALREVRHTGHVVLTVDDRGPGVPPEDRRRIWEPFERLGNRGGATGGAGLGLSVVRDLVRAHRGTVHVEDAPGGGARFVVVLPRLAAPRGAASGGVVVPRAPSRRDRHGAPQPLSA